MNLPAFFFIILYLKIDTEEKRCSRYALLPICAVINLVTFEHALYWSSYRVKNKDVLTGTFLTS